LFPATAGDSDFLLETYPWIDLTSAVAREVAADLLRRADELDTKAAPPGGWNAGRSLDPDPYRS